MNRSLGLVLLITGEEGRGGREGGGGVSLDLPLITSLFSAAGRISSLMPNSASDRVSDKEMRVRR